MRSVSGRKYPVAYPAADKFTFCVLMGALENGLDEDDGGPASSNFVYFGLKNVTRESFQKYV
jgi:hypothetical protein